MKLPATNDYVVSGTVLLAAAATLLVVATVTNRGDLTSATLFLCGVAMFLAGVFMLSFSRGEPFDAEVASLLSVQNMLNVCRTCADLGIRGDAWILPPAGGAGPVREFVPVAGQDIPPVVPDFSFVTGPDTPGIVLVPAAAPLIGYCERKFSLVIPPAEEELVTAIRELALDVLELADGLEIVRNGDSLVMTVSGYRLFSGCMVVASESPKCCSMHPCGICSLAACMLARGTGIPWQVSHVSFGDGKKQVTAIFRSLPSPAPTGAGPGNSR
jgi:hypothetical protein